MRASFPVVQRTEVRWVATEMNSVMKRRLQMLRCPFQDGVQEDNELSQQRVLCWLEDVHIRRWTPEQRAVLREVPISARALTEYSRALHLPVTDNRLGTLVPYLLDVAASLHYDDCAAVYGDATDPWYGRRVPTVPADPQLPAAAQQLLQALGLDVDVPAPDALQIAADVLADHLSPPMCDTTLRSFALGFSTGDAAVDKVATVLRLLHVRDLRRLQDVINDRIAVMQSVTANPKTDSKLGKVGR